MRQTQKSRADKVSVRLDLREVAERIARELHADLKAKTLLKIGIEDIEERCGAVLPSSSFDRERLIEATTRRVVELCI